MRRRFPLSWLLLPLALVLAACGADTTWAPDDAVARAAYRADAPPSLTLFTVRSNRSGEGAHAGLMINASQRVLFDPAGSFRHPRAPEQGDVLFGITPGMLDVYIDYHSRVTYHTVIQTVEVPPEVAEHALALARQAGAAPKAFCANAISGILGELEGFETIPHSFFPNRIMNAFAEIEGVETRTVYQDDDADNAAVLAAADVAAAAALAGD
ncbi:MAG: hypothetical protein H5U20_00905 [Rhodobacteraceae bacterium]|nr:hypothetical protein [Paracoccaceae bacterium]